MFGIHDSSGECDNNLSRFHPPTGSSPFSYNDDYCGDDFITLSYSPLGILLSLTVAVILAAAIFLLGRNKLNPLPVVGSCSAAIAASCHAMSSEQVAWEKPLRWGAFTEHNEEQHHSVGHCGLSSHEVEQPVENALYI